MSITNASTYRSLLLALPVLALWFALVLAGNVGGIFQTPPEQPPLALFLVILTPVGVFGLAYRIFSGFRKFVLSLDLRLITMLQSWRVVGASFLFLYAFGVLPGAFALPAGWGDIAIGMAAPFYAFALVSGKGVSRRAFLTWNGLGILDFLVAATLGILMTPGPQGLLAGELTTEAMNLLPLAMIPTFLVPMFTILHIIALLQLAKMPSTRLQPAGLQAVARAA